MAVQSSASHNLSFFSSPLSPLTAKYVLLEVPKAHLFVYSTFKRLSELMRLCCFPKYSETEKQADYKFPIMQKVGVVADDSYVV